MTTTYTDAENEISAIVSTICTAYAIVEDRMHWAEDEIAAAQKRHPAHADILWHSFGVLGIGEDKPSELAYRAHYRELLERIATGRDTRHATAVEVLCVLRAASLAAPLSSPAAGLYFRMWDAAGLPDFDPNGHVTERTHYEALYGSRIDEYEAQVRRRLTHDQRVIVADLLTCCGKHNGEPVTCRYSSPRTEHLDAPAPIRAQRMSAQPGEQLQIL
ncbi:hypothetical protein [Nocardia jejuensis]|uniref:hypothetical protein n=1 Tax=Nocardia jejuensis TaxID=328049 RepID=UPI0008378096|nr:hypothetical protein [Nocardia jejuensis]